jgi:hypothetical protein
MGCTRPPVVPRPRSTAFRPFWLAAPVPPATEGRGPVGSPSGSSWSSAGDRARRGRRPVGSGRDHRCYRAHRGRGRNRKVPRPHRNREAGRPNAVTPAGTRSRARAAAVTGSRPRGATRHRGSPLIRATETLDGSSAIDPTDDLCDDPECGRAASDAEATFDVPPPMPACGSRASCPAAACPQSPERPARRPPR